MSPIEIHSETGRVECQDEGADLRMVLVQGVQRILGPFGEDSDLRGWG